MGSRAVVVVCRSPAVAARSASRRPGRSTPARAGRSSARRRRRGAAWTGSATPCGAAGLWDELGTDWLLLDAELLPWSAKAERADPRPVRERRARPPGRAAGRPRRCSSGRRRAGSTSTELRDRLAPARPAIDGVHRRVPALLLADRRAGRGAAGAVPVLAGDGPQLRRQDHGWHLALADRLVAADPELFAHRPGGWWSTWRDPASVAAATDWWLELTGGRRRGHGGQAVRRPSTPGRRGASRAKCRGREYLRIIYGPDYTVPDSWPGCGSAACGRKRDLALREHGLGLAALDRLAAGEPLWRVHELVFAVLAWSRSRSIPVS